VNQPNFYATIPAPVLYDKRLSSSEKLLYGHFSALSVKEGFCWASNQYFAEVMGVHEDTVSSWVSHLKECGHIWIKITGGTQRKIYIVKEVVGKNTGGGRRKHLPVVGENTDIVIQERNTTKVEASSTFTFEEFLTTQGYSQDSIVDSEGNTAIWWEKDGTRIKPAEINRLKRVFKQQNHTPSEVDRFADAITAVMKKHFNKHPAIGFQEKKRIKENLMSQMDKGELKSYAQWYFVDADLPIDRRFNLFSFTDNYWLNKFRSQNE